MGEKTARRRRECGTRIFRRDRGREKETGQKLDGWLAVGNFERWEEDGRRSGR